ncbi:MAG TPA: helix-turn-helix domain-containing protein [Jatrophihabitantaceae bacterium]|jgi:AcrR family transcriptional regulator
MSPRSYVMTRRAEAAARTHRRLVEATAALHAERGVAATSMRDIAARADVGIGTVYHHFASYEDAIRACGAHTVQLSRPPVSTVFDGVRGWRRRVRVLVDELFAYYDRQGRSWGRIRADAPSYPALSEMLSRRQAHIRQFVATALAPLAPDPRTVDTVVALTDYAMHHQLIEAGLSTEQASAQIFDVLTAWLGKHKRSSHRLERDSR